MTPPRCLITRKWNERPDPEWFAIVRVGDVLRSPGKSYRVVREARRDENGRLRGVTFAIMRCSWTKRPTTTYIRMDLKVGWSYVGARVKLTNEIDEKLARDVHAETSADCVLRCCDVRGVA
jgi:hypothetical protein